MKNYYEQAHPVIESAEEMGREKDLKQNSCKRPDSSFYNRVKWVDEYMKNVSPYIYVREEDNLLIKIPNEAYKLNPEGLKILKTMLSGRSIYCIIDKFPDRNKAAEDIHYFFCDLMALLKGCYNEHDNRLAIEKIPFTLPFNTLPVLSEIAVTYRCNLACKFCYASCGCRKSKALKEMSTKQIKQTLSIIKNDAKVPSVSFTGGEPVLREDLPELIKFAKSEKMWTNLITNGTLITEKLASELKEAGLDSSQVSIEAGNRGLHNSIVQNPEAFNKTIQGVTSLIKAGVRVHTNTTISGLNKNNLMDILKLVKDLGLNKFSMNMLMPEGSAINNFNEVMISYSEIGDIVLDIFKEARTLNLEFMWYSPTPMCMFNPVIHGLGNKGCAACDGLLSISPSGDIYPCSSYPKSMANILKLKGKFSEAWHGKEFEFFQRKRFAHDKCQKCDKLSICNGGCPLYWKQVGYNELVNMEKEHEVIKSMF